MSEHLCYYCAEYGECAEVYSYAVCHLCLQAMTGPDSQAYAPDTEPVTLRCPDSSGFRAYLNSPRSLTHNTEMNIRHRIPEA